MFLGQRVPAGVFTKDRELVYRQQLKGKEDIRIGTHAAASSDGQIATTMDRYLATRPPPSKQKKKDCAPLDTYCAQQRTKIKIYERTNIKNENVAPA